MQGYIYLRHKAVKELMRPREDIIFYDTNKPIEDLEKILVDQEVSRLPVCDGDLENMKGIISIRNYFLQKEKLSRKEDLIPLLD